MVAVTELARDGDQILSSLRRDGSDYVTAPLKSLVNIARGHGFSWIDEFQVRARKVSFRRGIVPLEL